MDSAPDAGLLPVPQSSPAGHAAATAHLARQVLPRNAGLQDKDNAGQYRAVVQRFSAGGSKSPLLHGQYRFDQIP